MQHKFTARGFGRNTFSEIFHSIVPPLYFTNLCAQFYQFEFQILQLFFTYSFLTLSFFYPMSCIFPKHVKADWQKVYTQYDYEMYTRASKQGLDSRSYYSEVSQIFPFSQIRENREHSRKYFHESRPCFTVKKQVCRKLRIKFPSQKVSKQRRISLLREHVTWRTKPFTTVYANSR